MEGGVATGIRRAAVLCVAACALTHVCGAQAPTIIKRVEEASMAPGSRLTVAVRSVDEPTVSLSNVSIRMRAAGPDTLESSKFRRLQLDGSQDVSDTLPSGEYELLVNRPGFAPYRLTVTAVSGCTLSIEIYLSRVYTCLLRCESTPPRATVTTCGSAEK